jgi:hypothetical protein
VRPQAERRVTEPSPVPGTSAAQPESGRLQVGVRPWGEVTVDGNVVGPPPMVLTLPAGIHAIRFVHPDFQPLLRKVDIKPGETYKLEVDFSIVGVPR